MIMLLKKKNHEDKITKWASTRASISEHQQAAFLEEHKLKMIFNTTKA